MTTFVTNLHFEATGSTRLQLNASACTAYFYGNSVTFANTATTTEMLVLPVPIVTVFTANGTFTKNTSTIWLEVTVVGSGGGGGGARNDGLVGSSCAGGGGGAGGYSYKMLATALVGATEPVIVGIGTGTGGVANSTVATAGSSGTDSMFGNSTSLFNNVYSTGGGGGGFSNVTGSVLTGGQGGQGFNGDINLTGGWGEDGWEIKLATTQNWALRGSSMGGAGGIVPMYGARGETGALGLVYGSGGGAGAANASITNEAGFSGSNGIVIISEFIRTV